jgi:DNA adenine methylase
MKSTGNGAPIGGSVKPFLKWAGGKRWLVPYMNAMTLGLTGRYIEPFVGSGAIYFALEPRRALLSDVNESLVETFRCVRDHPREIEQALQAHHSRHSYSHYYEMRDRQYADRIERAVQFIYLNRTCWNGLYRVNRNGKFNVPVGTKTRVRLPSDDWFAASELLSGAMLHCQDFERTVDAAESGDLVFADPPYTVKHNLNGFIKYNESLFSWDDQIRLRDSVARARTRGAKVVVTNADHESVRQLYKDFDLRPLERASVLSGDPAYRGRYSELLITAI